MKTSSDREKSLKALLKKIGTAAAPEVPADEDPAETLVRSMLLWESTSAKAEAAYRRISEQQVDLNDLRVSMPHEIESMLGSRYPLAAERAERLRAALRDLYLREHAVSLERLRGMGKREIRHYLETLAGITPYAAARVMLLAFSIHAVPVDEQLRARLVEAGVAEESATIATLSSWLGRQVKAADAVRTHAAFQRWMDRSKRRAAGGRKTATTTRGARSRTRKTAGKGKSTKTAKARRTRKKTAAGRGGG